MIEKLQEVVKNTRDVVSIRMFRAIHGQREGDYQQNSVKRRQKRTGRPQNTPVQTRNTVNHLQEEIGGGINDPHEGKGGYAG